MQKPSWKDVTVVKLQECADKTEKQVDYDIYKKRLCIFNLEQKQARQIFFSLRLLIKAVIM